MRDIADGEVAVGAFPFVDRRREDHDGHDRRQVKRFWDSVVPVWVSGHPSVHRLRSPGARVPDRDPLFVQSRCAGYAGVVYSFYFR